MTCTKQKLKTQVKSPWEKKYALQFNERTYIKVSNHLIFLFLKKKPETKQKPSKSIYKCLLFKIKGLLFTWV